ncbi:MAG: hypothetical protein LBT32_01810 [Peptococcaceae bacterium]|jgi:hypothetical protein|nr:hypothetical protein [Peptococcaceae bacterium]
MLILPYGKYRLESGYSVAEVVEVLNKELESVEYFMGEVRDANFSLYRKLMSWQKNPA